MKTRFDIAYHVRGGGTFWGTHYAESDTGITALLADKWQEVDNSSVIVVLNNDKAAAIRSDDIAVITVSKYTK